MAFDNPLRITSIEIIGEPSRSYPFKGDVLAYGIRDRVNGIFERARIDQRVVHIEIGQPQEIKIEVPGEKFSASAVANFLREVLRIEPNEITGTLIQVYPVKIDSSDPELSGARYRLILMKSDKLGILFDQEGSDPRFD